MSQPTACLFSVTLISALVIGTDAIAGQPATVPLAIVHNSPNFSAEIDGHKVRLWFYLGADASLTLSGATLDELGIKPTGPGRRFMDVKGNKLEARTFNVARLRIGTAVFTAISGVVDVHAPPLGQGYIGPSLFAAYQIILDYRGGKITLIPPGTQLTESDSCRGAPVPFPEGVSKAQTDFGDLTLVWDTGAGVSFIRKSRIDQGQTKVVNQTVLTEHFRLSGVDFGPLAFRLIDFSEPPSVDGFIGANFFAKHVVCLDFPRKRLRIQR